MSKLALLGGKPIFKENLPKYSSLSVREEKAVAAVMKKKILSDFVARAGDYFLGGEYVKKLEKNFSDHFKIKYAVSFNSASTALQAAVGALGVGPGDEVITSPFTMSATAAAVLWNNALPVFADINESNFCLDAQSVEKNITARTKAILAVNLFGGAVDYGPLLKLAKNHGLKIIEDNAQAPGADYRGKYTGTIGDIGVFSFNFHKTIQCGEGGVLVTNNKKYALRAQLIRNHGEAVVDDMGFFEPVLGNNYRLTELHAAVASEQLKKLEKLNKQRILLANRLAKQLGQFNWLIPFYPVKNSVHVYYVYPFRFLTKKVGIKRTTFVKALKAEGFPVDEGYQKPLYLLPAYQKQEIYPGSRFPFVSKEYPHHVSYDKGICPVAERMYDEELLITTVCQPPWSKKEIDLFVQAAKKIEENIDSLKAYEEKA